MLAAAPAQAPTQLPVRSPQCLVVADTTSDRTEGDKKLLELAASPFSLPGDDGFVLGSLMAAPASTAERDQTRLYFKQLRTAVSKRLGARIYNEDGSPNKWWMAFSKRKFMNKELK